MKKRLDEVFDKSKIASCLQQETRQNFKVYDFVGEKCRITKIGELKDKENLKALEVNNGNAKIIYCLSVDNCLIRIKEERQKKCDCILFDEVQLVFVEMKTNTVSNYLETLYDRCEGAERQIMETYKFLNEQNISLTGFRKKGIICFTNTVLTGKTLRTNNNSMQGFRKTFLKKHGFRISIGNKVSFE